MRLQRECSDDELLELWTLALKAMELKNGPQVGCFGCGTVGKLEGASGRGVVTMTLSGSHLKRKYEWKPFCIEVEKQTNNI